MKEKKMQEIRKILKIALLKIGIRPDLVGFNYILYAAELVVLEPDLINFLCKDLYVRVSKNFKVKNAYCIERSIRHAIDTALYTKGFSQLNNMFKSNLYPQGKRPTSGELIRLLAEYYNCGLYSEDNLITHMNAI